MNQKLAKILLVDDNEADNYLHKLIITEVGIAESVVDMLDGEAALEYLKSNPEDQAPDLIFLDINMPRMNGWEFLDAYKQLPLVKKNAIVIIMLTTSVFGKDRERAEQMSQFAGFLNKPLTEESLLKVIHKHFEK